MIRALVLICTFIISGCSFFIMGENVMFVSGDIRNRSTKSCELHLIYDSESVARNYNIQAVSGIFTVDYVVAPTNEKYAVEVKCNGQLIVRRVALYSESNEAFDLGEI